MADEDCRGPFLSHAETTLQVPCAMDLFVLVSHEVLNFTYHEAEENILEVESSPT